MNLRQARLVSEEKGPSPENDRRWISRKISYRAEGGYWTVILRDCESIYNDMPGGGTPERLDALLKVLEEEGFGIKKSRDFSGSFREISWSVN